jgi:aminopeptidase
MSLAEYEDFVYGAGMLDADDPVAVWRAVHDEQQRIADFLGAKKTIRLVGPDTDLTYHTAGRNWINADGHKNFPDGEVFTSPDESLTEGMIRYSFPAIYGGREVSDIRLVFREGKVVEASAAKGQDLLHSLLDMDEGARRLGEAAFGTNYGIQRFTKNILFDEKIGGTIHLALGSSFKEIGGRNESALHWDMICDMRSGGMAYADGELFYKDGKFLI